LKYIILEDHRSCNNAKAFQVFYILKELGFCDIRSNKKIYVKNIFMTMIHLNKPKISFTNQSFF